MDKVVAIHQPNYLPWMGYFHKISRSEVFVFLDDAQFSNEGMHNYTYIKTPNGAFRLKLPVNQRFGDRINQVSSKDELHWKGKHMEIIESNYRSAKFFDEVFSDYISILEQEYSNIAEMNIAFIKFFCKKLGLVSRFVLSSELNINLLKTERIIAICTLLGATRYFSGNGARAYQNEEDFIKAGISLQYSNYVPVVYPQVGDGFQLNVSALDFFMNCGYDWNLIIRSQHKTT
ncbi:MAG: WbqC family protein [Prolixibacteraceae bacterium]|nr:WbqC family protein [Prolixibacteraceae bacterium]